MARRFERAGRKNNPRRDAEKLVKPINRPKGMSRSTVKDYLTTYDERDEAMDPAKRDLRPKDVFQPKPRNMNVMDYATRGWPGTSDDYSDMERAIRKEIPKDKGYATVSNLSQYLVETEGGGGTRAVGK